MSKRLTKEFAALAAESPDWISFSLDNDNIYAWKAVMEGPENSPYEKGKFKINIAIPQEYPFKAPTITFDTKVYHPNIKSDGTICNDVLNKWSPQIKIVDVMNTIRQVLIEPNPDSPLEADIGDLFKSDRAKFEKNAKEWTKKYAS